MKNQDEFTVQDIAAIQKHIISIRNVHAILDRDLAVMYDVEVKHLNRQVKRNIERFPADFMFQLTKEECTRCQIGTLYERGEKSLNWSTYRPYAFTENDVAMLSGVLTLCLTPLIAATCFQAGYCPQSRSLTRYGMSRV